MSFSLSLSRCITTYPHKIWLLALQPEMFVFWPQGLPDGWTHQRFQVVDISHLHVTREFHAFKQFERVLWYIQLQHTCLPT